MLSRLSSSLGQAHLSHGKSVGKHFPLWACAYTALAATATFFILVGMKRFNVSLGALQKILQPIQHRLGSTGCLTSFVAGSVLGGATLGLVSLPAWGKGHPGFTSSFIEEKFFFERKVEMFRSPTCVGYSLTRVHPLVSSLLKSEKIHISFMGRLASAVEAIAFPILALLDLTIGLASLPFTAITLGNHEGSKRVTLKSGTSALVGIFLVVGCMENALLPRPTSQ